MKRLLLSAFTALLTAANFAATECVVYSPLVEPASALRLSTISGDPDADETSWSFPSSYTGHRAVCRLPEATSNDSFIAWLGGESYSPGNWMGVSTARDFPVIGLTKVSPICNRLGIWSGASDRDDDWNQVLVNKALTLPEAVSWIGGDEAKRTWYRNYLTNRVRLSKPPVIDRPTRVRVVRYAVDDTYCYSVGSDGVPQRTVLDKVFYPDGRNFLCEADFLGDGKFDIDWEFLRNEAFDRLPSQSWGITNMTYIVVFGDGPTTFSGPFDTNTTVNAMATMITRRFERTRSTPKAIGLAGGSVLHGSRPTFVWSMPDEDSYAKRYGSSYTAFRIQVLDFDRQELVWTSDTMRAPVQNDEENFVWQAPPYAGSQTTNVLPVLTAGVHYQWRVSMTNAKFMPAVKIADDIWATPSDFTVSDDPEPEPVESGNSAVECVVYSRKKSNSSLHVSTVVTNAWERPRQWDFPSSYTGHRAVCRLTSASPNASFIAWLGGESYSPGNWMGVSTARDFPVIGLTKVSPICNRLGIWSGASDRDDDWNQVLIDKALTLPDVVSWIGGDEAKRTWYRNYLTNRVRLSKPPVIDRPTRVRVVRYAVDDTYCYSVGSYGVPQRTVLDKVFYPDGRNFLCEADFLGDGKFDIDWTYLRDEVVNASGAAQAGLEVSNMTYLVVIGDGPTTFSGPFDTNTTVNAMSTMITRRFETTRHAPVAENVAIGEGDRPALKWSIPDEDPWAKEYGTSYTAFRLQILEADGRTVVSTSTVHRLPPQDANGRFTWIPPDDTGATVGRKWRVVMYNSKYKKLAERNDWNHASNLAEFTE